MAEKAARFGASLLIYEDSEWHDRSFFVGKNKTNLWLLRFTENTGLRLEQTLGTNPAAAKILRSCTVTQVNYLLTIPSDSFLNNAEKWRSEVEKCLATSSGSKKSIYLEQSSVSVGRKGSSRFVCFQPLEMRGKEKEFSKILITHHLTNQAAMRFLTGLFGKSSNLDNLMAFMAHETLKNANLENELFEFMLAALSRTYRLGSVLVEDVRTSSGNASSSELRYINASCTAMLNKAVVKSSTKDVFNLLNTRFFNLLLLPRDEFDNS